MNPLNFFHPLSPHPIRPECNLARHVTHMQIPPGRALTMNCATPPSSHITATCHTRNTPYMHRIMQHPKHRPWAAPRSAHNIQHTSRNVHTLPPRPTTRS